MDDTILILNTDYHIKSDRFRSVFFTKRTIKNDSDRCTLIIHPVQAMILSFFTFDRKLSDNLKLLSSFLNKPQEIVYKMILPFIENDKPFKTTWQGCDIIFPRNVLINVNSNKNFSMNRVEVSELKCEGKIDILTERFFVSPSKLTFMLTNKCVTNCLYCYADRSTHISQLLPMYQYYKIY